MWECINVFLTNLAAANQEGTEGLGKDQLMWDTQKLASLITKSRSEVKSIGEAKASSANRFRRTALARSWRDRRAGGAPQIPSLGNCDDLVFTRSVLKLKTLELFIMDPSELA